MPCYHPMIAVRELNGKVKVIGAEASANVVNYRWQNESFIKTFTIPCGKCIGCRLEYSRQWAIRCVKELETTKGQSWFLTLTYDNDHLPRKTFQEEASGTRVQVGELRPTDLQLFIKRLRERVRRKYNVELRFFACGEYGDKYKRPHYHAIIFNLPLEETDMSYWSSNEGHVLYRNSFIDEVWNKGIVTVQEVTWECCAYVARYVMKKATGPNGFSYASDNGLQEEFVRMSRRPGIGQQYYINHKDDIFKVTFSDFGVKKVSPGNLGYAVTNNGPVLLRSCKYYDKLFDVEDSFGLAQVKRGRLAEAQRVNSLLMSKTSISPYEYRWNQEVQKNSKVGYFSRDFD